MRGTGILTAIFLIGAAQTASSATLSGMVTSAGGEFEFITSESIIEDGLMVGFNNQQSDNLFAFDEVQNYKIVENLTPDIGDEIKAGTVVSSHYVFYDPVRGRVSGYVDFNTPILGVLTSLGNLMNTDPSPGVEGERNVLGLEDVDYLSRRLRGLERRDLVSFDDNRLLVNFRASSPGDYIRVITEGDTPSVVPVPASGLLLLGALGLLAARRRT